jgi:hypothetical protein
MGNGVGESTVEFVGIGDGRESSLISGIITCTRVVICVCEEAVPLDCLLDSIWSKCLLKRGS